MIAGVRAALDKARLQGLTQKILGELETWNKRMEEAMFAVYDDRFRSKGNRNTVQ